jgi:hypothetical protein
MFIKQKKLMSKCRACGNENILDGSHRAGTQLMKNLPKDMSEIDSNKKDTNKEEEKKEDKVDSDDDKKEKKKKKKAEEQSEEEPITIDSEEIGKYNLFLRGKLTMNALSLPLIYLNDYNWFCNPDVYFLKLSFNFDC